MSHFSLKARLVAAFSLVSTLTLFVALVGLWGIESGNSAFFEMGHNQSVGASDESAK
jgi:hypothetical protein